MLCACRWWSRVTDTSLKWHLPVVQRNKQCILLLLSVIFGGIPIGSCIFMFKTVRMHVWALSSLTVLSLVSSLVFASPRQLTSGKDDLLADAGAQNGLQSELKSEQLISFSGLLALNICYSVAKQIDYTTAATAATSSLYTFVRDRYSGRVEGAPAQFQGKRKLVEWLALDLQLRTTSICPSRLPKKVVEESKRVRSIMTNNQRSK